MHLTGEDPNFGPNKYCPALRIIFLFTGVPSGGILSFVCRHLKTNWFTHIYDATTFISIINRFTHYVNSSFTARVFKNTFKSIKVVPTVLYPSINTKAFDRNEKHLLNINIPEIQEDSFVFLSINRFERKKNLGLAIHAMQALETILRDEEWNKLHLVIAGGYDTRVTENVEYYDELVELCEKRNLASKVTFMKSPSDHMKVSLLAQCDCVLYTPENEHFGIVPLEAMYSSKPVIAVKSGGPTETIVHESTGYLTEPIPENMAHYMAKLIGHDELREKLGSSGKRRFMDKFSFQTFCRYLNSIVFSVTSEGY
ncbi:ALG2 alpha-13/16-mannosyltransferase [Carabus blaptoides fortunei]